MSPAQTRTFKINIKGAFSPAPARAFKLNTRGGPHHSTNESLQAPDKRDLSAQHKREHSSLRRKRVFSPAQTRTFKFNAKGGPSALHRRGPSSSAQKRGLQPSTDESLQDQQKRGPSAQHKMRAFQININESVQSQQPIRVPVAWPIRHTGTKESRLDQHTRNPSSSSPLQSHLALHDRKSWIQYPNGIRVPHKRAFSTNAIHLTQNIREHYSLSPTTA